MWLANQEFRALWGIYCLPSLQASRGSASRRLTPPVVLASEQLEDLLFAVK